MRCIAGIINRFAIALAVMAMVWTGVAGTAFAADDDREYDEDTPRHVFPYRFAQVTSPTGFFHIAPVVGATGIMGDLATRGRTAEVEFSPVDAAESLDLDVGVSVEVGHGRTSVLADMRYLHAVTDELALDNGQDSRLDLRHFVSHLALHHAYLPHRDIRIGPVGGLRIIYAVARLAGDEGMATRSTQTWVEPTVGVRGRFELGDVVFIPYHADVGALGLGSRTTWQAYGALGLNVDDVDFELGYRHMYLDLNAETDPRYDLHISGPMLAITFGWGLR